MSNIPFSSIINNGITIGTLSGNIPSTYSSITSSSNNSLILSGVNTNTLCLLSGISNPRSGNDATNKTWVESYLYSKLNNFLDISGNYNISNLNILYDAIIKGSFIIGNNKFIIDNSGNITAPTVSISGSLNINNVTNINSTGYLKTNNLTLSGPFNINNNMNIDICGNVYANNASISGYVSCNNITITGTGNIDDYLNKLKNTMTFQDISSSGIRGNSISIGSNKFNIDSSGNLIINGNLNINSNKFMVKDNGDISINTNLYVSTIGLDISDSIIASTKYVNNALILRDASLNNIINTGLKTKANISNQTFTGNTTISGILNIGGFTSDNSNNIISNASLSLYQLDEYPDLSTARNSSMPDWSLYRTGTAIKIKYPIIPTMIAYNSTNIFVTWLDSTAPTFNMIEPKLKINPYTSFTLNATTLNNINFNFNSSWSFGIKTIRTTVVQDVLEIDFDSALNNWGPNTAYGQGDSPVPIIFQINQLLASNSYFTTKPYTGFPTWWSNGMYILISYNIINKKFTINVYDYIGTNLFNIISTTGYTYTNLKTPFHIYTNSNPCNFNTGIYYDPTGNSNFAKMSAYFS